MKIMTSLKWTAAVAMTFGLAAVALADNPAPGNIPPASTKQGVTYVTDIKPIFDNSCVKCHSGDHAKARLKMDSLDGALKGTKQGKVIIAGDSAKSWLVKVVAHAAPDNHDWMPPLNNRANIPPLTADQIGLIRAWIDQGAK
jgi:hypothetical protein